MSGPTTKTPLPGIGSIGSATTGGANATAATHATKTADTRSSWGIFLDLRSSCMGAENSENLLAIAPIDDERWWRRRWRWRWRVISVPDFLSDIALPHVHVPEGVADTVIPNYWVVNHVACMDRR